IPKLIEMIALKVSLDIEPPKSPGIVGMLPSLLEDHPSMQALVDYGELALPALADAYLKSNDEDRQLDIAYVLLEKKNSKRTKVFLQGLLLETQDHRSTMRLLELIRQLQSSDRYTEGSPP